MIVSLTGIISYKTPSLRKDGYVVVNVQGVGYKVATPSSSLEKITEGDNITIFTYMSFNDRSGFDLYGFLEPADKTFFTLLLEVPGIGPKSAIGILDKATMSDVQQAILNDDVGILTAASGLTAKTAEKIVVALRDKVEKLASRGSVGGKAVTRAIIDADVLEALTSLGYSANEAKQAIAGIDASLTDSSERLKAALMQLAKK